MLYIAGVILIIIGIVQLVRYFIKSTRNKVETKIDEIIFDYHHKDTQQIRKHPHALVRYTYRGESYEQKIFLMKRGLKQGDKILLSINEKNPEKAEMFAPKQEIITGVVLIIIGIVILMACHFLIDKLG